MLPVTAKSFAFLAHFLLGHHLGELMLSSYPVQLSLVI
jgi:hypothetical protein